MSLSLHRRPHRSNDCVPSKRRAGTGPQAHHDSGPGKSFDMSLLKTSQDSAIHVSKEVDHSGYIASRESNISTQCCSSSFGAQLRRDITHPTGCQIGMNLPDSAGSTSPLDGGYNEALRSVRTGLQSTTLDTKEESSYPRDVRERNDMFIFGNTGLRRHPFSWEVSTEPSEEEQTAQTEEHFQASRQI